MSAVLTGPSIPSQFAELFQNKAFTDALIDFILNNPEARERIVGLVDSRIVEEHKLPKKVKKIEAILGLADVEYTEFLKIEAEENGTELEPTIPEQMSLLVGRIDNLSELTVASPKTVTETRASLLVDHLKQVKPTPEGLVYLPHYRIISFLKHEIQEYRADKVKNIRQVKKEVLDKAVEMYPDRILLDKKKHGRREVRVILVSSEDRQDLQTIQREGS